MSVEVRRTFLISEEKKEFYSLTTGVFVIWDNGTDGVQRGVEEDGIGVEMGQGTKSKLSGRWLCRYDARTLLSRWMTVLVYVEIGTSPLNDRQLRWNSSNIPQTEERPY